MLHGFRSPPPRRRSPSSSLDDQGVVRTNSSGGGLNTSAGDNAALSGPLNIRALSGVVISGEKDSVLGWRNRGTGSFSMDGTSDAGTATTAPAAGGGRGSFEARRNMSLHQLQKAIKSVMLTDGEMYQKLQVGGAGVAEEGAKEGEVAGQAVHWMNDEQTELDCIILSG